MLPVSVPTIVPPRLRNTVLRPVKKMIVGTPPKSPDGSAAVIANR
jgi:hypothetical protein